MHSYVKTIKVPFKVLFVSACNSYVNNHEFLFNFQEPQPYVPPEKPKNVKEKSNFLQKSKTEDKSNKDGSDVDESNKDGSDVDESSKDESSKDEDKKEGGAVSEELKA